MSNHIIDAADALVEQLNAATLSQSFTAARRYRVDDLWETVAAGLQVLVVPVSREMTPVMRSHTALQETMGLQVAVVVGFSTEPTLAQVDAYMQLTDEIISELKGTPNLTWTGAGAGTAALQGVTHSPIWSRQHLEELNAFLSLITATYLGQF